MGILTGIDVFKLMDVAEDRVVPMMDTPIRIDRDALILGYAGVYSSFLLHTERVDSEEECDLTSVLGVEKNLDVILARNIIAVGFRCANDISVNFARLDAEPDRIGRIPYEDFSRFLGRSSIDWLVL